MVFHVHLHPFCFLLIDDPSLSFVQSWIGNLFPLDYGELWAVVFISYTPSTFNFADVIYYNIFSSIQLVSTLHNIINGLVFIFTFCLMGAVWFIYLFLILHDVLLFSLCKLTSELSIGHNLISTCASAYDWLSCRKCTCWRIIVCSNLSV